MHSGYYLQSVIVLLNCMQTFLPSEALIKTTSSDVDFSEMEIAWLSNWFYQSAVEMTHFKCLQLTVNDINGCNVKATL